MDAETHPDLFWAIRGGGGNFGVATRFQFRLHEVDTIVGGMLILPATPEVIASFIAAAEAAPEELSTIANVMPAPPMPFLPAEHHGKLIVMALLVYAGEAEAGERAIAPFRALATPLADMVRPMPYPEIYPPDERTTTRPAVARTMFVDAIDRRVAETIVDHLAGFDRVDARGAAAGAGRGDGPRARRRHRVRAPRARIMVNVAALYERPEETAVHEAWVDRLRGGAAPGRRRRVRQLPGRRGRGARPRGLPGPTWDRLRGDQGALRPDQPLPAQPEHSTRGRIAPRRTAADTRPDRGGGDCLGAGLLPAGNAGACRP